VILVVSTRMCLIAAVVVGLNACSRGAGDPPANATSSPDFPPATAPTAAPAPVPVTPPETLPETKVASTVKPRLTQPATPKAANKLDSIPTLDLTALEDQLKATKAIGFFSKIALKNQVDDLLKQFRDHYRGKNNATMAELRQSYDLLMMKVLSLIQDEDQKLAAAIVSSRAAIWALLADPVKFAALDV
jgi:hypothetical protein